MSSSNFKDKLELVLKILGVAWSIVALVATAAFFFGGEWNKWEDVKHRVLADEVAVGIEGLPLGTILPWDSMVRDQAGNPTGATREVPAGWKICNGKNGAPDLSDRFLMGVTNIASAGEIGGSNALPGAGQHDHGGRTRSFKGYIQGEINYDAEKGRQSPFHIEHGISGETSHDHGGENRPAYYSVVFIIKLETSAP